MIIFMQCNKIINWVKKLQAIFKDVVSKIYDVMKQIYRPTLNHDWKFF